MHNVYTFRARYVVVAFTLNYLSHFFGRGLLKSLFFALTALGI